MGGGGDGGGVKPATAVQVCVLRDSTGQFPSVVDDNLLEIRTSQDVFVWTIPDVFYPELWMSSAVFVVHMKHTNVTYQWLAGTHNAHISFCRLRCTRHNKTLQQCLRVTLLL